VTNAVTKSEDAGGSFMLKDALRVAIENSNKKKECKISEIMSSLDEETKLSFVEAMASNAKTTDITRALNANGIQVGREFLGQKRECFKEMSKDCCVRQVIDSCVNKIEEKK
jgi:hypothetical protein